MNVPDSIEGGPGRALPPRAAAGARRQAAAGRMILKNR